MVAIRAMEFLLAFLLVKATYAKGCEIRLLMPFRPEVTRGFQPFLCAPGEAPLTVSLLPVQALPEVRGRELLRNYAFAVFRTEDGFFSRLPRPA